MPPIPANQLLNQHLDNVGIALRSKKPFTPNDFPAVRKYEQVIKNQPVEHAYVFDSTGMPISHVAGDFISVIPEYPKTSGFDAPVGTMTHNHPVETTAMPGLSVGDLNHSIVRQLPIRGVMPMSNQVHEFAMNDSPLPNNVVESIRGHMENVQSPLSYSGEIGRFYKGYRQDQTTPNLMSTNPSDYLDQVGGDAKKARDFAEYIDMENQVDLARAERLDQELPKTINPMYKTYPLPNSAPDATMAADSFAIQRKPKPLIAIEPGRSSAGDYDFDAAFAGMIDDRLARYGY